MNQKPVSMPFVLRYVYAILVIIVIAVGFAVTVLFLGQQDEIRTRDQVQSFHIESVVELQALARETRMLMARIDGEPDSAPTNLAGAAGIQSMQLGFGGILHSMRSRLARLSALQAPQESPIIAMALERLVDRFNDIEQVLIDLDLTQDAPVALQVLSSSIEQHVRLHQIAADKELSNLDDRLSERPRYLNILAASIGLGTLAVGYLIFLLRRSLAKQEKIKFALAESEKQLHQTQKLEALGRLVGGVAHDFNNQLTAILGQAELLQGAVAGDKNLELGLEEIKAAGLNAASLTKQLLVFGQKQPTKPCILNLNDALMEMEERMSRLVGDDVTLTCTYADDPCVIFLDPDQLQLVILNLVRNAHDATPLGGSISVATTYVTENEEVAGVPLGNYVRLSVSDSGAGVDDYTRQRMFEPFYTTKEQGQGTGLGLSTVHGIVASAGGHIVANSQLGVGSQFHVYFPCARAESDWAPVQELPARQNLGSETVLVVEDDAQVRRFVETGLTELGYHVLTASGGARGLEICKNAPGEIDVILSDIVMAEVSGPTFMRSATVLRPHAVAIYMSSYTEDAVLGLRRGEQRMKIPLITKPFDLDSLSRLIRECLDESGSTKSSADQPGESRHAL